MVKNYIKGAIDTHVHSAPDVRNRKMSDWDLVKAAIKHEAKGLVIKSHVFATAGRAASLNEVIEDVLHSEFRLYGGVTLNHNVGGINPYAVDASLKIGGKIVWLPTIHSEHECLAKGDTSGVPCVVNGHVTDELSTVLNLIKEYDAALATSHISPDEIFTVVEAAKNKGISKIIISHPESRLVGLTVEQQKQLADDYNVMLERCYAQPVGDGTYLSNLENNYDAVRYIGAKNIIIATDAGQPQNPYWYESYQKSIQFLAEKGISDSDLDQMTKINPCQVLGIQ